MSCKSPEQCRYCKDVRLRPGSACQEICGTPAGRSGSACSLQASQSLRLQREAERRSRCTGCPQASPPTSSKASLSQTSNQVHPAAADWLRCPTHTLLDTRLSLMSRCVMAHVDKPHHPAVPIAWQVNCALLGWDETIKTCDMRSYATVGLEMSWFCRLEGADVHRGLPLPQLLPRTVPAQQLLVRLRHAQCREDQNSRH